MQLLTAEQGKWLTTEGGELIRWGLTALVIAGIRKLRKAIAEIRPGIIHEISTAFDSKLAAQAADLVSHAASNDRQFEAQFKEIRAYKEENTRALIEVNAKLSAIMAMFPHLPHPATKAAHGG